MKPKRPAKNSLAYFKQLWAEASVGGSSKWVINALAQLSYENVAMRKRLAAVEAVLLAQMTGMVERQGNMHLLECDKRHFSSAACTCGSTPTKKTTTAAGYKATKGRSS
jgi:hypothetical protein